MPWVWHPEDGEGLISGLRRGTVLETDDSGTQQILKKLRGLSSEQFTDVYRAQPHGFSSHAWNKSEGLFLPLGGRADRLIAIGYEHKDKRFTDLKEGETVVYYDKTRFVKVGADNIEVNGGGKEVKVTNADKVTATATTRAALGVQGGRWINAKSGRVNLGVTAPDDDAPCAVGTECGLSAVVFARID